MAYGFGFLAGSGIRFKGGPDDPAQEPPWRHPQALTSIPEQRRFIFPKTKRYLHGLNFCFWSSNHSFTSMQAILGSRARETRHFYF